MNMGRYGSIAFAGAWEDWSDAARVAWIQATGNVSEAFEHWKNSRKVAIGGTDDSVGPGSATAPNPLYRPLETNILKRAGVAFAPWTDVGKAARGLPVNWSSDPAVVKAGITGWVEQKTKEGEKFATEVIPTQPATGSTGTPNTTGRVVGGATASQPVVMVGWAKDEEENIPFIPEEEEGKTGVMLLVAAGLAAYLFLKPKRGGGALSGYSPRRRRRSRRR